MSMNYEETMKQARKMRLEQSKEFDVPELGGKLRLGPALAGPALDNQAAMKSVQMTGQAPDQRAVARLLAAGCMNDDGTQFFKSEDDALAFLGEISLQAMNTILLKIGEASGTQKSGATPKGNSETSPSAA